MHQTGYFLFQVFKYNPKRKPTKGMTKQNVISIENMIISDNVDITKICHKYMNSNNSVQNNDIRSSKIVRHFYLDQGTKLGWCPIPKVYRGWSFKSYYKITSINFVLIIVAIEFKFDSFHLGWIIYNKKYFDVYNQSL